MSERFRSEKITAQIALAALGALLVGVACAKHIYQFTDANGIVHYTDVKPADDTPDVKSSVVKAEREPLVRLREDGTDSDRTLTFVNSAGGPVTIQIAFVEHTNTHTDPSLPLSVVVAGLSEMHALHISAEQPQSGFSYRFQYTYMPGDYRAKPDAAKYAVPVAGNFIVAQAFGGRASHTDAQNHYAVDIGMPEGTPVLAARAGVVMSVDNDFYGAGLDMARYGDRANNIRVVHSDGTMAIYAHLQLEGARVQVGDRVRVGQVLALSGDTGYSSGPHLHFCVQINDHMNLVSVPFEFSGRDGGFIPTEGMHLGDN